MHLISQLTATRHATVAAGSGPLLAGIVLATFVACCAAQSNSPSAITPTGLNQTAMLDWRLRVHDPSTVAKCKSEYWVFSTGNGVKSLHSRDLVNWAPGPAVFATSPAWTREVVADYRNSFWAPDVIHVGGRYLLYYSASRWGKNTSAIGLASKATLDPDDPA